MTGHDVIVVGGGPAGSTAARRLAQSDLEVLLLDKDEFPRMKAGAGAISWPMEETLDFDWEEVIQRRPHGFWMHSPSGVIVDCTTSYHKGFMVMRDEFDHLLLKKAAEAGVQVEEGTKVVKAEQSANRVSVTTESGEKHSAKYLVGADGINSVVAKSLGFYRGWPDKTAAVCIEVEAEVGEDVVERICGVPSTDGGTGFRILLGSVTYGYAWCFPKRSILSVGVGARQDRVQDLRGQFNTWFERFKLEHDLEPEIISDMSARVPYSGARRTTFLGRTLLVGDSAGFVNPYDQEGIMMSVKSGVLAASVLDSAVKSSDPKTLPEYEKAWKAEFGDVLKVGKKIANILFKSEKNMETVCRLGAEDSVIRDIMLKLVEGVEPYNKLYRGLIKRILLRHPRAGLSLYT